MADIKKVNNEVELRKWSSHIEPFLKDIHEWVKEGYTEESIVKKLGICYQTWINYKNTKLELIETLTRARRERFQLMKNKQYQKACGMIIPLKKQKVLKDGTVVDIEEEMYIAPDTNAAEFVSRHDDPDYVPPKQVESGNITINNFQLPEAKAKVEQLLSEREKLKAIDITGFEVVEAE